MSAEVLLTWAAATCEDRWRLLQTSLRVKMSRTERNHVLGLLAVVVVRDIIHVHVLLILRVSWRGVSIATRRRNHIARRYTLEAWGLLWKSLLELWKQIDRSLFLIDVE